MTFYVLLYNNYCVTVPIIWINFEQSSFKMPATKNLTQSCRKQLSPHDDWNEFKFHKHFGPYDIYLSARSVEQAVAQMSTSDDNIVLQEETKNIAKKRLIKARKFYGDTSNEDEPKKKKIIKFPSNYIPESGKSVSQLSSQPINESSTITNLACGSIKANDEALTNVPTKSVNDINEPEISDEILETNFVDVNSLDSYEDESSCSDTEMQKMTHEKQESRKVVKGNITARPTIVSQLIIRPSTSNDGTNVLNMIQNKENVGNNSILPSTSNDDTNVLNIIQNKENIENNSMTLEHSFCCEKCRKNYLVKFVTIERKLNRIIHFLENENNVQRNEIEQDDVSLLPNFPLTTVEQTEMFNKRLEDINVRRQFMKKMAQFGGDTVAKLVKNIMLETIGYEVAAAYTWTGQKKRLSFKTSKLADTIIAIILKKKDTTTITEVEGCIQEWLRRSGDRKRGLNK